jgi:hypothetical protein
MAEMPTLEFRWEYPHVQCILGEIVIDERTERRFHVGHPRGPYVRNLFVTFWWIIERVMKKIR